jgi:bacillithiol synthase
VGEPGPPLDRFHDALLDDLAHRGPLARERFATHFADHDALTALADAKRAPLPAALAAELEAYHRRLGAPPESLAALARLARGEAVCAVAGQQPAPLGGPLYSLHKTACAVGLAADVEARTGRACVPLFWTHGEDSDFAEVRTVTVADATLALHDLTLPDSAHRDGGLVGAIPGAAVAALHADALARWEGLPARDEVAALLARVDGVARDLGEVMSALMLALFGARGLVVVDPRLPAFRAAARPIVDRYLADAGALSAAARRAGERLEPVLGRRPLSDAALESFVFAVDDGARRKVSAADARGCATLSPSAALRPAVQDGVLPTVAMACGPGEVAYLAQLREVFEGLGVRAACPVPRFGATWLAPAAVELMEAAGVTAAELVTAPDAVLRAHAERAMPSEVRAALEGARRAAMEDFARVEQAVRALDASLPQMVESARAKSDYQYARLFEGVAGKVRQRLDRQHPAWPRVRYHLSPGDKLQERRLASLEPVAHRGVRVGEELAVLATEHAARVAAGEHAHAVLELGS